MRRLGLHTPRAAPLRLLLHPVLLPALLIAISTAWSDARDWQSIAGNRGGSAAHRRIPDRMAAAPAPGGPRHAKQAAAAVRAF